MTSLRPLTPVSASVDRSLALLVEEWTTRLQSGEAGDEDAFLAQHPAHADELRLLLPALRAMAELGRSGVSIEVGSAPVEALGTLGDFRLIREVGRGGMGVWCTRPSRCRCTARWL
jgi:eukaryotic-like serine/threonine-protein kinase